METFSARRTAAGIGIQVAFVMILGTASSAKAQTVTPLYAFCPPSQGPNCNDGRDPHAGLVQGSDGNFYGTTYYGGPANAGTIFQITPSGALTTLYSFCSQSNCTDGRQPIGALVQGSDGSFYGTTTGGGSPLICGADPQWVGCGTVFKINSSGAFSVLYTFCTAGGYCPDGAIPVGLAEGSDGNFYGATAGAPGDSDISYTPGTVFQVTPRGTLTTLYTFCSQSNCTDGLNPYGAPVQGRDGNLYGTTYNGGANGPFSGGTVYKLTPGGALTTLYSFCLQSGCPDGYLPYAGLVQGGDGNFYGTTWFGGANVDASAGTVFKITPSGALTTLYSFCSQSNCADGQWTVAPLVEGADGNFYGTTYDGGANGGENGSGGTIFKITPSGAFTKLWDFCSLSNCADGYVPYAGLIQGNDGNFYGTNWVGGVNGAGTVFSLAVPPNAGLSPGSLKFAPQDVGTSSAPQPVTLSNTGPVPLAVSSIVASGDFAQTNNCNGAVAAGGSCTINVTFAPTGTGTLNGTLTITDNSNGVPGSQQTVSLSGTGYNPGATLSPASLNFGAQPINTSSANKTVTITSSGTTSLSNISISITGANAADFAQTNDCPATLKAGSKCSVSITFTPSVLAAESAALDVNDNAANSPQTVAISGTGIVPVSLSPSSAGFGNVPQATPSAARNFTVKNNQSVALSISSIGFTGSNPSDFSSGGTCGSTLAAHASCTISVMFTPSLIGAESAALTVNESAPPPYNTLTASLTGAGIAQVAVSPTSITYGPQKVGTTSGARIVNLKNNLSTALSIGGFTFTGADPSDFAVSTNTCGASLAAKSNCTASVVFKPTATGTRTATLNVNDSANNSPQTVSLTGTGE